MEKKGVMEILLSIPTAGAVTESMLSFTVCTAVIKSLQLSEF